MPPGRARAHAVAVGIAAVGLIFFLTGAVALPVVLYFPLSRRLGFEAAPGELSMDYYGRSLLALGGGAVAGGLAYGVCRMLRERGPRALTVLTAYAATAVLLCASLFAFKLYNRVPTPEPLPPDAQQR